MDFTSHHFKTSGVKSELQINASPTILGEFHTLQQALTNLVVNAVQAVSAKGSGNGLVTLSVALDNDKARISVMDNGAGIDPTVRETIFDPFVTTKPVEQGTGLGLWIARQIVNAHSGEIEIESEKGNGATFTLVLPLLETL